MFKSGFLACAVTAAIFFSLPSQAQNLTLDELQGLSASNEAILNSNGAMDKDHWAYKTLENISQKYGLILGEPGGKYDRTKPLSRNEAAILLVNLAGRIEQNNIKLSDVEKAQLDIVKQELAKETKALMEKVTALEATVDSLKGSVSKLEEADGKNWKFDYGEKFKITGGFQGQFAGNLKKGVDNYPSNFGIPYSLVAIQGKISPHLDYFTGLVPSRAFDSSGGNGIVEEMYVSTDIIPKHKVYIGQTYVPMGYEGPMSPLAIDTIDKSQIARKLSNYQDLGILLKGDWDIFSYSIGGYNGNGTYTGDSTNSDLDLVTWASIKPLKKLSQYGNLEFAGGFQLGKNSTFNHNTIGFYSGYQYKRCKIYGEYSFADGYLNYNQKAKGWYINGMYNLTDKMALLARFDNFDPDKYANNDRTAEYTLGSNYSLTSNVFLMLNLVHVSNQSAKDSDRVGVLTQVTF